MIAGVSSESSGGRAIRNRNFTEISRKRKTEPAVANSACDGFHLKVAAASLLRVPALGRSGDSLTTDYPDEDPRVSLNFAILRFITGKLTPNSPILIRDHSSNPWSKSFLADVVSLMEAPCVPSG
jgi:hypothetical protein